MLEYQVHRGDIGPIGSQCPDEERLSLAQFSITSTKKRLLSTESCCVRRKRHSAQVFVAVQAEDWELTPGDIGPDLPPKRGDVTILLEASAAGSEEARDQLSTMVYGELLGMARARMRAERTGHTLTATALVHETFVRLFRVSGIPIDSNALTWQDRAAFFGAAATAMKRILVEHARARSRVKRGGKWKLEATRIDLNAVEASQRLDPELFLSLTESIERLESVDQRAAEVTRLRFFAGLSVTEVAEVLDVTDRTVKRDWQFARAWLRQQLLGQEQDPERVGDGTTE